MKDWMEYLTAQKLMERWQIDAEELAQAFFFAQLDFRIIRSKGEREYRPKEIFGEKHISDFRRYDRILRLFNDELIYDNEPATAIFFIWDIKEFQKKHGDSLPLVRQDNPESQGPILTIRKGRNSDLLMKN